MQDDSPVRFFAQHAAVGMLLAVAATVLVYVTDFVGIGGLLDRSKESALFVGVMILVLGPTLAAVQITFALFFDRAEDDSGRGS